MDAQTEDANSYTPLSANCPIVLKLEDVKEVIAHSLIERELIVPLQGLQQGIPRAHQGRSVIHSVIPNKMIKA